MTREEKILVDIEKQVRRLANRANDQAVTREELRAGISELLSSVVAKRRSFLPSSRSTLAVRGV